MYFVYLVLQLYLYVMQPNIVTESAGEHGPGATLCFWGTKLAQASVPGASGFAIPSFSHANMQCLCICINVI